MELTEQELLSRFHNYEDPFVERKSEGDQKDYLKTAIAFANTLPDGVSGVLFVPVMNDGKIQTANLDTLQMRISERLKPAYPSLVYSQRIVNIGQQQVVAVLVPGSPQRPHFAGPAYVRDGSQTKNASEQQFQELIARRSSKVEELKKWVGKKVTVEFIALGQGPRVENSFRVDLEECTLWYATIKYEDTMISLKPRESFALSRVEISYDQKHHRLLLDVHR